MSDHVQGCSQFQLTFVTSD